MPEEAGEERPERTLKLEIFLAIGLGLAAIITATASFRSALIEDQMIAGFNKGIAAVDQAGQAYSQAQQTQVRDQALFLEYAKAAQEGNADLVVYIFRSLMTKNLRQSIEWWEDDPDAFTPFEEGSPYRQPALDQWNALKAEGQRHFAEATEADEATDRFDFVTVIAAVVLFFFGLASVVRHRVIRRTFIGVGGVALAGSIVLLLLFELQA